MTATRMDKPGRPRSRLVALLLVTTASLLTIVTLPAPAQAHRSGCHRWHSCPSDSGSYVCGDLGYNTYCGTDPATSPAEIDFTPPTAPTVAAAGPSPGGQVRVVIDAESGAQVEVLDETGRIVTQTRGTGKAHTLTFKASEGTHTYTARATDAAGNASELSSELKVTADATPPPAQALTVTPARPSFEATRVTFRTEAGAAYKLSVLGRRDLVQGVTAGEENLDLWLPNGRHTLRLELRDQAGNAASFTRVTTISISQPSVAARRTSRDNQNPARFEITASPRSTGTLTLPGRPSQQFTVGMTGTAEVDLELPDGAYPAGNVKLTDFLRRSNNTTIPAFTIDTQPPDLQVTVDGRQALDGHLSLTVTSEPGATVHVGGQLGSLQINKRFQAATSAEVIAATPKPGRYTLTTTASDQAGNTTTRKTDVAIEDPLTPAEFLVGIGLVALLVGAVALGAYQAWVHRNALRQRLERRRFLALQRAHEVALERYQADLASHRRTEEAWSKRRDELVRLLELAQCGVHPCHLNSPDLQLRAEEQVLSSFPGFMVEQRQRQGTTSVARVGEGTVTITNQRYLFHGPKNREWAIDKLQTLHHVGSDTTLMTVTNRQKPSGIGYPRDPERTRLLVDLARADETLRSELIEQLQQQVVRHDHLFPVAPTPPTGPASPTLPRS